jgi:hypothetical protein
LFPGVAQHCIHSVSSSVRSCAGTDTTSSLGSEHSSAVFVLLDLIMKL